MKEEGIEVVLINPNIATVQTSKSLGKASPDKVLVVIVIVLVVIVLVLVVVLVVSAQKCQCLRNVSPDKVVVLLDHS